MNRLVEKMLIKESTLKEKILIKNLTKEKSLPTLERVSPEMKERIMKIGQMEYECYIKYQKYINRQDINWNINWNINKNIINNNENNTEKNKENNKENNTENNKEHNNKNSKENNNKNNKENNNKNKDENNNKIFYNTNKICEETEGYKQKINHPHDKAMRAVLSNKEEAAIIINISLGLDGTRKVKSSEIEEYKTDFVTKDYFNREIDIIYKDLTQQNLYYIIEHQTKVDYRMPMRLIEYYTEVMRNTYINREKSKKYELPKIIPIILYGGDKKWNAPKHLDKSKIAGREIIPMDIGEYIVLDANDYTIEKLKNKPGATLRLLLLEKSKTMKEAINQVEKMANQELDRETRNAIIQYINCFIEAKYGQEVAKNMIKKLNGNEEEESMLSDVLDQIEERGRKEGMTEALQESKRKMIKVAKSLLNKGLSKSEVAEITELDIKEINKIAD